MKDEWPLILTPALRHGVSEATIFHAIANQIASVTQEDGMTMIIGPDFDGAPVEVGVIDWYGTITVAHAMRPARSKFLRR